MKRGLAVLLLVAFCTGCFAMQRTPDATILQSVQTIAVIPLEPSVPTHVSAPPSGGGFGLGAASLVLLPFVVVGLIVVGAHEAHRVASIPEGTLTVERDLPAGSGMLTVNLAKTAAETLQRHEARTVYLVDGYLRLPIADQSQSLDDAQSEERTRIIRWYNEDATRVDYSGLGLEGLDAIFEVGIVDYQDFGSDVLLQVMVRLVDPVTKQVLGKARNWVGPSLVPLPLFLRSATPDPREQRDKVAGQTLVTQCLKDLGLIAE